jgi:hypothetical protein
MLQVNKFQKTLQKCHLYTLHYILYVYLKMKKGQVHMSINFQIIESRSSSQEGPRSDCRCRKGTINIESNGTSTSHITVPITCQLPCAGKVNHSFVSCLMSVQ